MEYQYRSIVYFHTVQFYPFGVTHGDTALPPPIDGEGSSPPITLNEDFVFYDNIIRTAYVRTYIRMYVRVYLIHYIMNYAIYVHIYNYVCTYATFLQKVLQVSRAT